IERMRNRGWRFALDDFGTGFSSFSQLKFLPVDMVKIDGQFVEDMNVDPIDNAIVIAINEIAHSLGMETVAEYVETPETLRALEAMGIDYAQGFYISRPMNCVRERVDSETQMLRLIEPISMC
ncbi:MAG TPA: EAL domain-containing protein, partial [Gammaproteobacteria bacterium]|nr:EAL domain-containing protein [Gammaproteobacteria bacterium]